MLGLNSNYKLFLFYPSLFTRAVFALVRSKLEYNLIAWKLIMSTDAKKLEWIQQKYVTTCQNRYFSCHHHVTYEDFFFKL